MVWNLIILVLSLIFLILSVSKFKLHPFIALLLATIILGISLGLGGTQTVDILLEGFGKTMKWIAIVVILGAFIGEVLSETGGALRISSSVIKWLGERKLPWGMGITGYLVSIPVFVDVAYIILQPVTEMLATKSKKPVLVIGLALTAGLTVSHTLIPPTPGPIAVASLLDVNIGRLLLINGFVGLCAMAGGILWAVHYCKKYWLPYDDKLVKKTSSSNIETIEGWTQTSILLDLLPILAPILLMGIGAFSASESQNFISQVLGFISIPTIAVLIGAGIAFVQLRIFKRTHKVNLLIEQAIVKSALVIMITGAGGSFGYMIQEGGIQDSLINFFENIPLLGVLLPFMIAAVLTTSTGSITVSLVGTASIVAPLVGSMPYSPEIMAALIGCGAFCVFHMNSSFFWLLNRLHEVPVNVLYKTFTVQSLVMGISGLIGVALLKVLGVY